MKNKTKPKNKTQSNPAQAINSTTSTPIHDRIYLGLDLHSDHIRVVRQFNLTNPQPAQKFTWEKIEEFIGKQKTLAKEVYVVYEAGAFGYELYRKLQKLGVICYVIQPVKLDSQNRKVQTDKTDARALAGLLVRYANGDNRAMSVVKVPTLEQEARRDEGRHRKHLANQLQNERAHGRGILLFKGFRNVGKWWEESPWAVLKDKLPAETRASLEDSRKIILELQTMLKPVEKKLTDSAPKDVPLGFGALTFVLLMREIHEWDRFKNRRQTGSFMGLCGGVSSSSNSHYDLSITKRGSGYLRRLLIELAWRMVRFQPEYHAVKKWAHILCDRKAHRRHRKRAIVALARQLAVDIWKWQTGRITLKELGLK